MSDPKQLAADWASLYQSAQQAIDWTCATRESAPRLDNEADDLILSLRRVRNNAKRLGQVCELPMTVGFFGMSQAGKSYLVSSMAAGKNGKLETLLGGKRLDFLAHINPPGGGVEATALVTRFTRAAPKGTDDFPLELKLFSEVEIAKILANSFFSDFDKGKVQYRFDHERIAQLLQELRKRRLQRRVPGVDEDDVVSLWDYLQQNFKALLADLPVDYWSEAIKLAPRLDIAGRSQLFGLLWNEIPELTQTYADFAQTLARLGHAPCVFAPLSALVQETPDGGLSQAGSMMNVNTLDLLGRDTQSIAVRPWQAAELGAAVELSRAQLAVLTAELVIPLLEPTSVAVFEQVDLLDFPGYRGRLKAEQLSIAGMKAQLSGEKAESPIAQMILRGKVAYLFERYTDSQEMNVLIFCTPANLQFDPNEVDEVLTRWVEKTQGATPQQRARRDPGLLWVITKFDIRQSAGMTQNEDLLSSSWGRGGMLKGCMLEQFGKHSWLTEWSNNKPFANTFLARNPVMHASFIERDAGNREQAVSASAEAQLALMRKTFCRDEAVRLHIKDAEAAWDAVMTLNEGGVGRIAEYLGGVAQVKVKLERIGEQLNETLLGLESRLGRWFQGEGAGELEKKRQIAQQIYQAIWPRRMLLGELLSHLPLPTAELRPLYLRAEQATPAEAEGEAEAAAAPASAAGSMALDLGDALDDDDGFDLFGSAPAPLAASGKASSAPATRGSDAQFAQAVVREWFSHLRHLPENLKLMGFLGFDSKAIEALVDELITAASRLKLQERMTAVLSSVEQIGTRREQLAGRQVLAASNLLGDFIGWLGFAEQPPDSRPTSRLAAGRPLFEPPPALAVGQLPQLSEKPQDYSRTYSADWLVGLARLAEENAGFSAGLEISAEQNDALGKLLARLRSLHQGE